MFGGALCAEVSFWALFCMGRDLSCLRSIRVAWPALAVSISWRSILGVVEDSERV